MSRMKLRHMRQSKTIDIDEPTTDFFYDSTSISRATPISYQTTQSLDQDIHRICHHQIPHHQPNIHHNQHQTSNQSSLTNPCPQLHASPHQTNCSINSNFNPDSPIHTTNISSNPPPYKSATEIEPVSTTNNNSAIISNNNAISNSDNKSSGDNISTALAVQPIQKNVNFDNIAYQQCDCSKISKSPLTKKDMFDNTNSSIIVTCNVGNSHTRWNQLRSKFFNMTSRNAASTFDVGFSSSLDRSEQKLLESELKDMNGENTTSKRNGSLGSENDEDDEEDDDDDDEYDGQQKKSKSSYLKEQFMSFFQPSDNKLALKLFGSKTAVLKERDRQKKEGKWVIHPCSSFRFYWDLFMLIMLIANLIILPVIVSFFSDDTRMQWLIFNGFSDFVFLMDIMVNFRTGLVLAEKSDEVILNTKIIARNYLKSWFSVDLVSSIPVDYIFLMLQQQGGSYQQFAYAGRTLRILRLAKLLSMLRLLRLSRLVRYVSQWEEFLNLASKFIGICKLVLLMLLLGHWNACIQYLIPHLMDFPAESWVVKCQLQKSDWFEKYTWALFKAMSHMLSIGYGRYPPTSIPEAWITIISMMTGATCYALFVGHAAALIQSFDTSKRLYREKFKQVEEYMTYRKLPRALRQRIANYYEHRYQGKMFNEEQIHTELNECLREQVINYNCRALVAAVPFFTHADPSFVSEVVSKLNYEVFQPGDLIIKEGTLGRKMYFIQEGIVDIITKDGEVVTSLSDGSYFGEICLLTNSKRVATVRAEVYCCLYSLDSDQFQAVLENYPLMRRTMESVAAERLAKIGYNPDIITNREDFKQDDLNLVKEIVSAVSPMIGFDGDSNNEIKTDPNSNNSNDDNGENSLKPVKEVRRRSVVKLGLSKLGLIKSKSNQSLSGKQADKSATPNPTNSNEPKDSTPKVVVETSALHHSNSSENIKKSNDNPMDDSTDNSKKKKDEETLPLDTTHLNSQESLNLNVRSPDGQKNTLFKISFDSA